MSESPEEVMQALIVRAAAVRLETTNEAKTRLEFIDRILEDVLGWPRERFNPETQSPGTKGKGGEGPPVSGKLSPPPRSGVRAILVLGA